MASLESESVKTVRHALNLNVIPKTVQLTTIFVTPRSERVDSKLFATAWLSCCIAMVYFTFSL
jgi:hypothetical protein